jgi:hypothetical protein
LFFQTLCWQSSFVIPEHLNADIAAIEIAAQKTCDNVIPFTFFDFENEFFKEKIDSTSIEVAYKSYIGQLRANEQFGSAELYEGSLVSLLKYQKNLRFEQITKEFLQSFENWMLSKGFLTTFCTILRPTPVPG